MTRLLIAVLVGAAITAPTAAAAPRLRVHVTGHMQPGAAGCTGYASQAACHGAIVTLYRNGSPVADHPVRCPMPVHLHVIGMTRHGAADVYACGRYYHWRIR